MASVKRDNFRHWGVLCLTLWTGLAFAELSSLKKQYETDSTLVSQKETEIASQTQELDRLSSEIKNLKTKKSSSFLQKYKLQSRLQQAQALSENILRLSSEKNDLSARTLASKQAYIDGLDQSIERQRGLLLNTGETLARRQQAAMLLSDQLSQRLDLTLSSFDQLKIHPTTLTVSTRDQGSLAEQLNAMDDLETNISKQVESLQSELILAQRQKSLNRELSQLMEEESFFGEQGFISLGVPRNPSKDTANALTLKAGSNANPEEGPIVDSGSATQGPPSVGTPSTGTDTAPLEPSIGLADKTLTTTKEIKTSGQERAAWLQEKRGKASIETTHLDRQINWLEGHVSRMRSMLDHVHQTQKEIRGLLHHP